MSRFIHACLWAALATLIPLTSSAGARPSTLTASLPSNSLAKSHLTNQRVLVSGTISQLGQRSVRLSPTHTATLEQIAAKAFAEDRQLTRSLKRSSAIYGTVRVQSEAAILDNSIVLVRRTQITVKEPRNLPRGAGIIKKSTRSSKRGGLAYLKRNAAAYTQFRSHRTRSRGLPVGHPLRQPARSGEQAFFAAVTSGIGEHEITTSLVVPKGDLEVVAGAVKFPKFTGTKLDYNRTSTRAIQLSAAALARVEASSTTPQQQPVRSGSAEATAKFITGFTIGDSWEWSRRWDFPSGYFRITALASYGLGLRVPVQIHAVVDPKRIQGAGKQNYGVSLLADTLDADAQFYTDAGMPSGKVFGGQELVAEVGFRVSYYLSAGWGRIVSSKGAGLDAFDDSKSFRPPFDASCRTCGVEYWIPPSVSGTEFSAGFVKGTIEAGFKLTGSGTVGIDYSSVVDGRTRYSTYNAKYRGVHALTLEPRTAIGLRTSLPDMGTAQVVGETNGLRKVMGGIQNYGFSLSAPEYNWKVKVVPGVRGTLKVRTAVYDDDFVVGPFWFDELGINAGTVTLGRHAGTRNKFTAIPGSRTR